MQILIACLQLKIHATFFRKTASRTNVTQISNIFYVDLICPSQKIGPTGFFLPVWHVLDLNVYRTMWTEFS